VAPDGTDRTVLVHYRRHRGRVRYRGRLPLDPELGFNAFAQNIQHDVRTDTYDKMQRLNMEFFSDKQTGR